MPQRPDYSALAWVDTIHCWEGWVRKGQREGERHLLWSPTLLCPIVLAPMASLWFALLFSCMHDSVLLEKSGDGEVGCGANGSKGMLCHMADSLLGLREGSKENVCTRDKQMKNVCFFFSNYLILHWLNCLNLISLKFVRKITIVARMT